MLLRHAFEPRHQSYFHNDFYDLLRRHGLGFVIADTAGKFGYAEHVTAAAWSQEGRDVHVYLDATSAS
jgi:hypothetical protein